MKPGYDCNQYTGCEDHLMTLNVRGMLLLTKMKHMCILCMTIHLNKYVFFLATAGRNCNGMLPILMVLLLAKFSMV